MPIADSPKPSLRTQYIFFAGIFSWLIVLGLVWMAYSAYRDFQESYAKDVRMHAYEVNYMFDEKISFIEHFLQFIGVQLQNLEDLDVRSIGEILKLHKRSAGAVDDNMMWNTVDYVTLDERLIADSISGTRRAIRLPSSRSWVDSAKKEPWKIKFAIPDLGVITKDYVLPIGMAITDEYSKILGFLSSGISIEKLTTSLMQIAEEHIVFALFDDDFNLVLASDPFINEKALKSYIVEHSSHIAEKKRKTSPILLDSYFRMGQFVFSHYVHSSKFPYWFIVGYNQAFYAKDLWSSIAPRFAMNVFMWILFASMLAYLSYQVVGPILKLGEAASLISQGIRVRVQKFKVQEFAVLGGQLSNIAKIQLDLKLKQSKLARANKELSAANEFIRGNMSFLSHELINPTASIVEFASMIKSSLDSNVGSEALEYINIIQDAALHLNKQLNFFMKVFRFQANKKVVEERSICLKKIVDWNLSMMMHHARYKQVRIFSEVPSDLHVKGDEIMVGQLIQNLAANGAKYNRDGGSLSVCGFKNESGEIELHFRDTGIGISNAELDSIFKIFQRTASAEKSREVGYGIGLAYAQSCIEAHQGRIEVSTMEGEGSLFKVIFPAERTIYNADIEKDDK